eukprot:scaffold323537_cov26-Tisochrysis_lutea.AAC.1
MCAQGRHAPHVWTRDVCTRRCVDKRCVDKEDMLHIISLSYASDVWTRYASDVCTICGLNVCTRHMHHTSAQDVHQTPALGIYFYVFCKACAVEQTAAGHNDSICIAHAHLYPGLHTLAKAAVISTIQGNMVPGQQ